MLVISRKPGERVHIGEDIQIAILEISGSRVVVGIAAPREIPIRRVGPMGYDGAPGEAAADVEDAPSQPDVQFEVRQMDAADLQEAAKRTPIMRVKRSRLKAVQAGMLADPLVSAR